MESHDRPRALPDGSRVVHIGPSKTGTTGLQAAFDAQRDELARHGVEYVSWTRHAYSAAKYAVDKAEPWHKKRAAKKWRRLSQGMQGSQARIALYSSEALSQGKRPHVRRIVDDFGGEGLQVVVTLRALAPVLASSWQQYLKRGEYATLDRWLRHYLPADDPEGLMLRRRKIDRLVRLWGSQTGGEENVTLVIPDPSDRSMLLHQFEDLLGLPTGALPQQPRDNSSLPFPESEYLRRLNQAYAEAGGDKVTYRRHVNFETDDAPISRLAGGLTPYPIRIPRWAAERSNELTERWLAGIEGSPVHVVGDPQHLFVDASTYPDEVELPTEVSVASAAALAESVFGAAVHNPAPEPPEAAEPAAPSTEPDVEQVPGRALAKELARRVRGRIGRT